MAKKREADLRKLARRQRWIIWLVLVSLLSNFLLPYLLSLTPLRGEVEVTLILGALLQIALNIVILVGVVLLLVAKGTHPVMIVLCAILMLAPCISLLVLVLINGRVTRTLRRAGLKVGLMGVDPKSVERVLNPNLCTNCGYDLTGNISGRCPECGWEVIYSTQGGL